MPGDNLLLMADLTRIMWRLSRHDRRSRPADVLRVFMEAIGPEGTLLVPAFDHDLLDGDAFDVRFTKPQTGALANAALSVEGSLRTLHPLHSFAVVGRQAEQLAQMENESSFGADSPFAWMHGNGVYLIALDLDLNDSLTYVHHVEELERVPYRSWKDFHIRYTDPAGHTSDRVFKLFAKRPGHHIQLNGMEQDLEAAGAMKRIDLDGVKALRIDLATAHRVFQQDIRKNRARGFHSFHLQIWSTDQLRRLFNAVTGGRTRRQRIAHAARSH
ncbi:MAG: AAC(3) family N-acetyltransferase [Flavobacteriales bacterium]|nr:AAC(3) family N-acetyltransferase [Flavobacteriales bacterium]